MGIRERIQRYKTEGAAAGLARVEVLVPPEGRGQILKLAARLRSEHRSAKAARAINAEAVNDRAKLIMHRLIARRMASDPKIIDAARNAISTAKSAGEPFDYLDEWQRLLATSADEIRRAITGRSATMRRLRTSSPFVLAAGFEDPDLRRRIWRKARSGLGNRGA